MFQAPIQCHMLINEQLEKFKNLVWFMQVGDWHALAVNIHITTDKLTF